MDAMAFKEKFYSFLDTLKFLTRECYYKMDVDQLK